MKWLVVPSITRKRKLLSVFLPDLSSMDRSPSVPTCRLTITFPQSWCEPTFTHCFSIVTSNLFYNSYEPTFTIEECIDAWTTEFLECWRNEGKQAAKAFYERLLILGYFPTTWLNKLFDDMEDMRGRSRLTHDWEYIPIAKATPFPRSE